MKKTAFILIISTLILVLTGYACAYSMRLPDNLAVIGEQAFMDNAALRKVVLPDGLARIESRAFAGSGLDSIYCSDLSKIEIADDALDDKAYFLFPLSEDYLSVICGERGQIDFSIYPPHVIYMNLTSQAATPQA